MEAGAVSLSACVAGGVMADLWYPGGVPDPAPSGVWGTFTDSGEPKFLLHTTEGHLGAYHPDPSTGADRRYYGNTGTWPNYTLAWHARSNGWRVYNHIPANRSSLSLRNRPGGVQTNRDNVTQVEIATRAAEILFLPDEALAELARLLKWEHVTRDVPLASTVRWVAYPASYGERASQRLSGPAWDAYAGVIGHQHAPENDHGDPGAFPIERLLTLAREILAPQSPEDVMTPEQEARLMAAIGAVPVAAAASVWGTGVPRDVLQGTTHDVVMETYRKAGRIERPGLTNLAALVSGATPVARVAHGDLMAALDELDDPADLVAIALRASALAHARMQPAAEEAPA